MLFLAVIVTFICFVARPRTFKVGIEHSFRPWCYLDPDTGELTGCDVDIVREISRRLGWKPKFVSINWTEKKELLYSRKIDTIWSCFTITGREQDFDCLGPIASNRLVAVVKMESPIQHIRDLSGKIVVVQAGTTSEDLFIEGGAYEHLATTFKKLIALEDVERCAGLLTTGIADVFVIDVDIAESYNERFPGKYRILETPLYSEQIGAGFRKNEPYFRNKFSEMLDKMNADGTLEKISEKHFGKKDRFCWGAD